MICGCFVFILMYLFIPSKLQKCYNFEGCVCFASYLNAIQTMCPHILRYLTTAVITNKGRRQKVLKDLVKVIQQVCCTICRL